MLTPIECFLYSCCGCTWFVPMSGQGRASEAIICCRAAGPECARGSVCSPWSCSGHQGHRAGSCWEHHIPSTARVNSLDCWYLIPIFDSSGQVWEPPWCLCLACPTRGMGGCVVPAPPASVGKGSWGQERNWVWLGPAPVPGQNSVLQQHSEICVLGSGIRDHLHLSLLQHPEPRLGHRGASLCCFYQVLQSKGQQKLSAPKIQIFA